MKSTQTEIIIRDKRPELEMAKALARLEKAVLSRVERDEIYVGMANGSQKTVFECLGIKLEIGAAIYPYALPSPSVDVNLTAHGIPEVFRVHVWLGRTGHGITTSVMDAGSKKQSFVTLEHVNQFFDIAQNGSFLLPPNGRQDDMAKQIFVCRMRGTHPSEYVRPEGSRPPSALEMHA